MFGASILLFRTLIMMFTEHAFKILVEWVIALLVAEFLIDLFFFLSSLKWFTSSNKENVTLPLRLGAMAIILHGIRVSIYVLGRIGPWINFDVKPEYHSSYTYNLFWVYFAGILAFLGVIGVFVLWQIIRSKKKRT